MGIFWVGIFWMQLFREKFTREESGRWDFPGGSFPVRSFPDTIHIYISGCIKSVYRYLVKIISDFRGICVLNDFYILVNSTWFNSKNISLYPIFWVLFRQLRPILLIVCNSQQPLKQCESLQHFQPIYTDI